MRDEEVLSVDPAESVPLTNFMQRVVRPRPPPQPQPQPYASVFASPVKGGVGGGGLSAGRPVTSTFFVVFFLGKESLIGRNQLLVSGRTLSQACFLAIKGKTQREKLKSSAF